jgi:inositol phosphorylceramide mannosyltransferase catalytic subunit
MRSMLPGSNFPVVVHILATLIGIAPNRYADFQEALQSRPIVPMVVVLVAIRFRRLIGKLAAPLAKISGAFFGSPTKNDGVAAGNGLALNATALARAGGEGQALLLPRAASGGSFPKVIFQTWKSKVWMPDNYARWSESLKRMNPDFDYVLWDDFDNRRFIEKCYPWFLPIYDAYPREIYRADAVRYFFLYQFGGLYADMDTECLRPVAPLFETGDIWLGRMGSDPDFPHSIPNAIMASRPLREFWLLAIHLLVENAKALGDPAAMVGKGPEAMTGPILLKNAYDIYISSDRRAVREMIHEIATRLPANLQPQAKTSRVDLLESDTWYPVNWSNMIHLRLSCEIVDFKLNLGGRTKRWLFPKSFLVTYWTHSWKNK